MFYRIILLSALALSACSHHAQTPFVARADTTETIKSPPPPTDTDLSEEVKMAFIRQAAKIRPNKNAGIPFGKLDYNKVIAYDYYGRVEYKAYDIVDYKGRLACTIKHQKAMSQDKVDWLTRFMDQKSTYGGGQSECFEPHLGIVFYKDSAIVAYLSICLACNVMHSNVDIPVIRAIENSRIQGFRDTSWNTLNDLCKEYNFYSYNYHRLGNKEIQDTIKTKGE